MRVVASLYPQQLSAAQKTALTKVIGGVLLTAVGVVCLPGPQVVNAAPEPAVKSHSSDEDLADLLGQVRHADAKFHERHRELERQITRAQISGSADVDSLQAWLRLVQTKAYRERLAALQQRLTAVSKLPDSSQLQSLKRDYDRLLTDFEAAREIPTARAVAKTARGDLMMYRMMKHVHDMGPVTKQAHALYKQAERDLDAGNLASALEGFRASADAFNQHAFQEVIDGFKQAGDAATRRAAEKLDAVQRQVNQLLEGHFVAVPAGRFTMGSNVGSDDEKPERDVEVPAFRLGRAEITFALWDLCVDVRACPRRPNDQGWGRGDRPVIDVSYDDITQDFIPWLEQMTGKQYSLPSEAQWEFTAQLDAVGDARFAWGEAIDCDLARFDGGFASECPAKTPNKISGTAPVESFKPTTLGLYDLHGNVWEWVEDCYTRSYANAPVDATPVNSVGCRLGVVRGGAWDSSSDALAITNRLYLPRTLRKSNLGFRLVELQ